MFLKGKLQEMECTLANIYCPNKNQTRYRKEVLEKLMDFEKGKLILAGDLNFCMNPQVDSSSHALGIGNHQLTIATISMPASGYMESPTSQGKKTILFTPQCMGHVLD